MNFRHMEVQKDRRNIRCFWESQPTGCTKPHCPFMHESIKDPYIPEAVLPASQALATTGKIIVNKNKLDELVFPNRTVILDSSQPSRKSIKDRLGAKIKDNDFNSEEENLRRGALGTIDLRKRLTSKRKHSEEEDDFSAEAEDEDFKMRSVVKKVKKERKEKKKKEKKEKKSKKSESRRRKSDAEDDEASTSSSTLAQRIAAQRDGIYATNRSDTEDESTTTVRKMKIKSRVEVKNQDKESVLSVIDDVDALLKSSEPLPAINASSAGENSDVMRELDELINS